MNAINNMKVYLSSNADSIKSICPDITIEAEYGDVCVEGEILTLAHHGVARSLNPPPCCVEVDGDFEGCVIGVSHIDLDTLGGIWNLFYKGDFVTKLFWKLAGAVDVQGPHKLPDILEQLENWADANGDWQSDSTCYMEEEFLYAWWAWADKNKVYAPRDGSCLDVTEYVIDCLNTLNSIFCNNKSLLEEGEKFKRQEKELNLCSFEYMFKHNKHLYGVRTSDDKFVNHLYTSPQGNVFDYILALNDKTGAITISKRDSSVEGNCCSLVQSYFGSLAGGHEGIAGSPRGVVYTLEDLFDFASHITGKKIPWK